MNSKWLWLLAGAVLSGCGGTAAPGDGGTVLVGDADGGARSDGGGSSTVGVTFCRDRLQASCEGLVTCGMFATAPGCLAYFAVADDFCRPGRASAPNDGLWSFDPAAAATCLAESRAPTSCAVFPSPSACDRVFVGQVPLLGACQRDADCAGDDRHCDDSALVCPGQCRPAIDAGEPASDVAPCAKGTYRYDFTGDNSACLPFVPLSGDCSPLGSDRLQRCEAGAYCRTDGGSLCAAAKAPGSPCLTDDECDFIVARIGPGTPGACKIPPGASAGVCTRAATAGQPCGIESTPSGPRIDPCQADLACLGGINGTGTCSAVLRDAGESCAFLDCLPHLDCRGFQLAANPDGGTSPIYAPGTCFAKPVGGQPCYQQQCAPGFACFQGTQCRGPQDAGACSSTLACAQGYECGPSPSLGSECLPSCGG